MKNWIDVRLSNGNLLATVRGDNNIKIIDKRQSKIIKTFEGIDTCKILSFDELYNVGKFIIMS